MIGLLDLDWCLSNKTSILIPNLEIMKLATYYKVEEKNFCRLLSIDEKEVEGYEKIYIFSETTPDPQIPENYRKLKNLVCGGSAFTDNQYIPFSNEIIDFTIPRPEIYKQALLDKYSNGVKSQVVEHVLDDTFYRNYAGDQRLPLPAIRPRKRVFLFDREFFYPDWEQTLEKISSRNPASIIRLHPIIVDDIDKFVRLRAFPKFKRDNEILFVMSYEEKQHKAMLDKYSDLLLAEITYASAVYLPLGGSYNFSNEYYRNFISVMKTLYSYWCRGIPVRIKFIPRNKTSYQNPIENLSKFLETTTNLSVQRNREKLLGDKIAAGKNKKKLIEEKELLCKIYPDARKIFDQSFDKLAEIGRW